MRRIFVLILLFPFTGIYSAPYLGVSVGNLYFPSLSIGYEFSRISLGTDISWWYSSFLGDSGLRHNDWGIDPTFDCRLLMNNINNLKCFSTFYTGTHFPFDYDFYINSGIGIGLEKHLTDNFAIIGQYSLEFSARNFKNTMWSLYQSPAIKMIYCFGKEHF